MNTLLLGDQTANIHPYLRQLCHVKGAALLQTFLEQAARVIREEVHRLPRTKRDKVPDFLTISQLLEAYIDCDAVAKLAQLESSLVTVTQLAHYLGYVYWCAQHGLLY
jgi:hypothetical protein